MSDAAEDWRELNALSALQVVATRDPRQYRFGFYGSDAGAGSFGWFTHRDEAFAFLEQHLPTMILDLYEAGDTHTDIEQVRKTVSTALRGVLTGELSDAAAMDAINACEYPLQHHVHWWGDFGELVQGQAEFAVSVREWFLDDGDGAAIPPEQVDEFVAALSEFGA